jgi:hypothetical protein
MNQEELYKSLSTTKPQIPVLETKPNPEPIVEKEITEEEAGIALDNIIAKAYKEYEELPPAQRLVAEVAPGTGEAISAYEAKKFGEETKEAFQEGKYGEAALKAGLTGLSVLGAVPIGGAIARGIKAGVKRGVKAGMSKVDETNLTLEEIKKAYKLEDSQRRAQPDILKNLAKDLEEGKITKTKWDEEVKKRNPISMFEEMPIIPSLKRIEAVIGARATNKIIGKDISLESLDGKRISNRLDIPSYNYYDTWVPTMHNLGAVKGEPGKVIGYGQTAVLKNVDFHTPDMQGTIKKALKVAQGTNKSPFAGMEGTFKNTPVQEAYNRASEILEQIKRGESDYIQVGYNPYRASYFYDRATGTPVLNAEEVIQVGPLVLAKKPIMGKATDFKFEKGGYVHNYIEGL